MKSVINLFTVILLSITLLLTGCSMTDQQEAKSILFSEIDSQQVQMIRNMTTEEGYKLGDLFDSGMGAPTYELYDPADDGNTYVTIKGNMTYRDVPVVVTIQYKKINETTYEFYTLTTNDIPANEIDIAAFFNFLRDEYEKQIVSQSRQNGLDHFLESDNQSVQSKDTLSHDFQDVQVIDKIELISLFKMIKEDIISMYGDDYEIRPAGVEGLLSGYYYKDLGITIVFNSQEEYAFVDYIYCDESIGIDGATSGMNFAQIQEKLGTTQIRESFEEIPAFVVYTIEYDFEGFSAIFKSFDKEGTDSFVTLERNSFIMQIGDYVQFGSYWDKPILWQCMDRKNGILLVSEYMICQKSFDAAESGEAIVFDYSCQASGSKAWSNSNIREWLNSSSELVKYTTQSPTKKALRSEKSYDNEPGFLYNFTEADRNRIKPVNHDGVDDKVFLLSVSEIDEYFRGIMCKNYNPVFSYSQSYGQSYSQSFNDINGSWFYWTRTPVENEWNESHVIVCDGTFCYYSELAAFVDNVGIVPAVWLKGDEDVSGFGTFDDPFYFIDNIDPE